MPEFSAWLAGVKERLEKATPGPWIVPKHWEGVFVKHSGPGPAEAPGGHDWLNIVGANAVLIASAPTDLALAVRIIEAVQQTIVNWRADDAGIQATFADDLEYALHSAFEETKA